MDCVYTNYIFGSGVPVTNAQGGTLLLEVPKDACRGRMLFYKVSTGDEIYITFAGKEPKTTQFAFRLTDDFPTYELPAIIPGELRALSSDASASLDFFIPFSRG